MVRTALEALAQEAYLDEVWKIMMMYHEIREARPELPSKDALQKALKVFE